MSSFSPPMDLDITIISAKHLKNVNWRDGDLVPSVVLSLSPSRRVSTRPDTSGSTRPVWNERFLLPLPRSPPPHSLSLKIVHAHDTDPDLLVGSVKVSLPDSVGTTRIDTLELLRPSGRPHGKIRVKLAVILRPPAPPPPPPPILQDYRIAPPVSSNYATAPAYPPPPPVVQSYHSAPPVSDNYNSATAPACPPGLGLPPPSIGSPEVKNYSFAPPGSYNCNSAIASTRPPPPPPPFAPVPPLPPPQQNYKFTPPGSNNYTSATAPGCPPGLGLPPPTIRSPEEKNYSFAPPGSDNYASATAPACPSIVPIGPPPPQQFSMVRPPPIVQNYNFAPPGSDNYNSATASTRPPPPPPPFAPVPPLPPPQKNYNFTPPGSNNYNSATAPAGRPGVLGRWPLTVSIMGRPPFVQNYSFTPLVSNNYTSASAPACPRVPGGPPVMRPPMVQNYNLTPHGSDNYNSSPSPTCPPFPHPPPPQQSFPPPPQAQDYSFTPPAPPQQSFPPPPPPREQYYNITPQGSNNYNSATATAYPLSPISGSAPPQQTYNYNNSYYDSYNAYIGNKNKESGNCGAGLVGAMRGLALEEEVESDMESTIDYSEYSESYIGRQPSAPIDDSMEVDRNRMMSGSEKVEHKVGSKESNVGPHYDYSEYRGSYGYN